MTDSQRRLKVTAVRAAGSAAMLTILLSGCSVPDAVNPVEWYRGASEAVTGRSSSQAAREAEARKVAERDYPDNRSVPDRPKVLSPEDRKDIAQGLVADRNNARHTAERINREGNPTRPLTPKPPQAAEPASPAAAPPGPPAAEPPPPPQSRAPAAAPAPATVATAAPTRAPVAAPTPVAAPPAQRSTQLAAAPVAPPPPAPVAAAPVYQRPPSAVDDAFRRRLAESAPATAPAASISAAAPAAEAIAATPASTALSRRSHVIFDYAPGRTGLSDADAIDLEDLADAAKRTGSRIRIVAGSLPEGSDARSLKRAHDVAVRRADAVIRELRHSGMPANRIDVSVTDSSDRVEVGLF